MKTLEQYFDEMGDPYKTGQMEDEALVRQLDGVKNFMEKEGLTSGKYAQVYQHIKSAIAAVMELNLVARGPGPSTSVPYSRGGASQTYGA